MAAANFGQWFDLEMKYEGGMSMDRRDPGNWTGGKVGKGALKGTKYGIAASAFPDLDIQALTKSDVIPIYRERYWDVIKGDDLPRGVDICVGDYGVNSGPSRAVKDLQREIGASVDGKAGPTTIERARIAEPVSLIKRLCARRMSFLRGLKTFSVFGKGWSRRVADVEARSVALTMVGTVSPGSARVALDTEAEKAKKQAAGNTATAGGLGTGGFAAGGTGAVFSTSELWFVAAVVVVLIVGAVIFSLRARHDKERAEAYAAAAARV